ncbi:hemerythrin domain-containing protein [Streptomyces sp. enrichment culture]|uniref:hemerythrin domain-containing protein n=1 Tax=Streptomyces sp. enrichment culture TaxID=1795815 RepID=UPI003F56F2A8
MTRSVAPLLPAHLTMLLAHRAMVRDLEWVARCAEQLAQSPDPARAAALRGYADRLFQVIEHHHEGEDEFLWPRLRRLGADEGALTLMTTEHAELATLLHDWHAASTRLGTDAGESTDAEAGASTGGGTGANTDAGTGASTGGGAGAAAELAGLTAKLRDQLSRHAADEERELSGRLAPVLDAAVWKGFSAHMRRTAPGWTLTFMPAWLASVAGPDERAGVPARPVAALFRGRLEKQRRAAFGAHG